MNKKRNKKKLRRHGKNINKEALHINLLSVTGQLENWTKVITNPRECMKRGVEISR